jgi:glucuronoarabinoxylan endo-1,4-beta-xylanase
MWGDSCQIDLSVPLENLDASLSIYPNPAQDQIFINLKSSSQGLSSIVVFDMIGQQVLSMTEAPRNQIQLNIASLPSGIYLLKVTDTQSKIRQTKFIIER